MELNSLLNSVRSFVSGAGSEQSTHSRYSRGWDSRTRCVLACRLDLNHPPTSVGGIWGAPHFSIIAGRHFFGSHIECLLMTVGIRLTINGKVHHSQIKRKSDEGLLKSGGQT